MDWYYAADGQQRGPVTEAQLDELFRAGTINHNTLLWRSGMKDWQPLGMARPSSAPASSSQPAAIGAGGPAAMCVECRRPFLQSDMVFVNRTWVCAECKPVFLQRMMEGGAPAASGEQVWRSQRQFVLRSEAPMPDRCVRCNAPANGYRLKRQLYWHSPVYYLLLLLGIPACLLGLLAYVIVTIIVRKRARIFIGLCETHRAQRKWTIIGCWLAVAVGLGMIILGIALEKGYPAVSGIFLTLGGTLWGLYKGPVVTAAKIDKDFVWVRGAGKAFLADLAEWSGPA